MFLVTKKNSLPPRMLVGRKADNAFRPRLEALEGRALPSVNHLSMSVPVVGMIIETSFTVPMNIRIDFITVVYQVASPSQAVAPQNAGSLDTRVAPAAVAPTPSLPSVAASLTSTVTPARGGGAPVVTETSVQPVSLISFTSPSTPAPRPVVIRPTSPDTPTLLFGLTMFADQPLPVNNL